MDQLNQSSDTTEVAEPQCSRIACSSSFNLSSKFISMDRRQGSFVPNLDCKHFSDMREPESAGPRPEPVFEIPPVAHPLVETSDGSDQ